MTTTGQWACCTHAMATEPSTSRPQPVGVETEDARLGPADDEAGREEVRAAPLALVDSLEVHRDRGAELVYEASITSTSRPRTEGSQGP